MDILKDPHFWELLMLAFLTLVHVVWILWRYPRP